jgi:hypothetical protein
MNPLRDIWLNTDKCIDYYLDSSNSKPYLLELVWIVGFTNGIRICLEFNSELRYFLLIVVPLITIIVFRAFYPWLLFQIGKLVGGHGSKRDLQLIVSLASIPYLLDLVYLILVIIIPGNQNISNGAIDFLVWIFALRILIIGVAKVQKVSYVFSFMNIFIPYFLLSGIRLILSL